MSKPLVIVESPTKARTIERFLGKEFNILASYGHVRDLPNNASEIPAKVKSEPWSRVGVNTEENFEPLYIIPESKKKQVKELRAQLKNASELLLATDEDREGESISWHLLEVLNPKVPVRRLVFHEITKDAINQALSQSRDVDLDLVKAQETRRIIDRLFGYEVSPLLWRKMAPRLSAGRVQSVAMRLLVERERERINFRSAIYWDIKAIFAPQKSGQEFEAELIELDQTRIATGKDFEQKTGALKKDAKVVHLNEKEALALKEALEQGQATVASVEKKPFTTKPYAPFTTSTLQQEANRKLNFSARRTMQVAQTLYENGFITYMRTDSTHLSKEAIEAARSFITSDYGNDYLPKEPRLYQTKVKNAQEAHEAIRPAGAAFTPMAEVKRKLGPEAFRLYELIWKRTIASQMTDARGTRVSTRIAVENAIFRAAGKTIQFPGFLRAYVEGSDDPEAELADREKLLPELEEGQELTAKDYQALSHETQPPARYTEGSLIKELERLGIGRPSTWATIVDVVLSRDYAFKRGNALVPTFLASAVTRLLESYFTLLLDYEFTASMEDDLDAIARGEADSQQYLQKFYFGNGHAGLKSLVEKGNEVIDPRDVCGIALGENKEGELVEVRIGRYGPFLTDGETRARVPDELPPDELSIEKALEILEEAARGPEALGEHPETKEPVYLKTGRFGPYIQMGEQGEGKEKPKMASLLPGMSASEVDFEIALKLLEFPKTIGQHPESKEDIVVANGRYGPYLKCDNETRSIPTDDISPLTITVEQAVELLKQPKRRGRTSSPKVLKELGKDEVSEKEISIRSGRYGPYVTDGEINASLPRGREPEGVTMAEARELLQARAAKIAAQGGPRKKKTTKKKAAKKKSTAKKKAAKKKTAKKSAAKKKTSKKKASSTKKKSSAKKSAS